MENFQSVANIGVVHLSSDFRVIGMNAYAKQALGAEASQFGKLVFEYHSKKSRPKIEFLLQRSLDSGMQGPVTMVIDVLNKVLMINVCRIEMAEPSAAPLFAMTFIDVTEQTGAKTNPHSGMMELKRFPIYDGDSYFFLDSASIYYIQSDGNYCKVFTKEKAFHLHLTLKNILRRYIGHSFFRAHKSYVVNLDHVRKIQRGENGKPQIVFDAEGLDSVPVAKRRMSELKEALSTL